VIENEFIRELRSSLTELLALMDKKTLRIVFPELHAYMVNRAVSSMFLMYTKLRENVITDTDTNALDALMMGLAGGAYDVHLAHHQEELRASIGSALVCLDTLEQDLRGDDNVPVN